MATKPKTTPADDAKEEPSTVGELPSEVNRHAIPDGMSLAEHFTRNHIITDAHLARCREPLPKDSIQEVKGKDSGKKYDSTGHGYQWIADRLSEVFGPGGWTEVHENLETTGTWGRNNTEYFHVVCRMTLMVGYWWTPGAGQFTADPGSVLTPVFVPSGSWTQYGEHKSANRGDVRKGAHTNAIKKVAALGLGIGADAFRGTIDEDMAGARPPMDTRREPARPAATPQQRAEMNRERDWGVPKQIRATKSGKCCLCADEIHSGEWLIYPVRHPYSGKRAAAHARCFDKEYPEEPVDRADANHQPAAAPPPARREPPDDDYDDQVDDAEGEDVGGEDPDDNLPF